MAGQSHAQSIIVRGDRLCLWDGQKNQIQPASMLIKNGVIAEIGLKNKTYSQFEKIPELDAQNLLVTPGVVDTHAHINEPGRTDWEGFATATLAAAAGGITTVIDMPLNSIPATTSLAAMKEKLAAAGTQCRIDFGLWGGVIPGNSAELEPMIKAGIMGFKCFLCPSGVDEFPHVSRADLNLAMPILAKHKRPLLVHAEIEGACTSFHKNPQDYETYLESRPPEWELEAIAMMIELAELHHCHVHIVHLSTAEALPMIKSAKERGVCLTVETCPHYLVFESENVQPNHTEFKCAPPIRNAANRQALWKGVVDGVIDFIVSDHSPCVPALKRFETGDFVKAWGGIAGLQLSFLSVWTEMQKHGLGISDLVRLMCMNTANFSGLSARKGVLAVGKDADFVLWDPELKHTVTADTILHRHKVTPYVGMSLLGQIHQVFLRGNEIFKLSKSPTAQTFGTLIRRSH